MVKLVSVLTPVIGTEEPNETRGTPGSAFNRS